MAKNSLNIPAHLVVIGGSAGALPVILNMASALGHTANVSILLVMHRKPAADDLLTPLIRSRTHWNVREVSDKDLLEVQNIYIVPANYHTLIEKDFTLSLDVSEKLHFCRPAIDVTFESAAEVFRHSLTGILLSGANADGVDGLAHIRLKGGICMVQDPDTAEVPYMPQQAVNRLSDIRIIQPQDIAAYINQL